MLIDELFAANFVNHIALPGITTDRESAKQSPAIAHTAFSDFHATFEGMSTEEHKPVQRSPRASGGWLFITMKAILNSYQTRK